MSMPFKEPRKQSRVVRRPLFFVILPLLFLLISPATGYVGAVEPQKRVQRRRQVRRSVETSKVDYSKFSHQTLKHAQSCDACHKFPSSNWKDVRAANDAFPDVTEYPHHTACMSCHNRQFFRGVRPVICSVCHVSVAPRNSPRFPFPSLGEPFFASEKGREFKSRFDINFPHDKHIEIVAWRKEVREPKGQVNFISTSFGQQGTSTAEASCGVCHQTYQAQGDSDDEYVTKPPKDWPDGAFWPKKGTFKTVPMTHATCFTCHSDDSELPPAPKDCNACHKIRTAEQAALSHSDFDLTIATTMGITDNISLMKWRKRESAAFRHEWFSHAELECASCHKIAAINSLDERSKKVPIMSCGGAGDGCHITSTTDEGGILNYVIDQRKTNPSFQCRKCHMIFGKQPVPQSHLDAIEAFKKK